MLKEEYWQAVLKRDCRLDGVIVYAVISTKIYCLPSCPSRKPKRSNVVIFNNHVAAEQAGFRPCKRCLPDRDSPKQKNLELIKILAEEFNQATIIRDDDSYKHWLEIILSFIAGKESNPNLLLDIRGTAFQQQVWQALQNIPYGETRTYTEIAQDVGKPKATRAIGNACGANRIALIIPCHRVIRSDGSLGGYRWGIERKQKLIQQEIQKSE